ncbi:MAG: hypothetical protein ACXVEW_13030 [Solirubrobacteraceae bacterium]
MKKLGTPIGAGPGSANEKLGFEGVGTPPVVRWGGGDELLFFFFFLFFPDEFPDPLDPTVPAGAGWLDGRWDLPGELGFGAVVVDVVGVVDEGVDCELPEPPVVVVCEPVVVPLGVLVVGVLVVGTGVGTLGVVTGGGHTLEINVAPGGSGAPGGSWSTTWPVAVWTVTVQLAADATGIAASPITVANEATAVTAILSFRLPNTLGFVLPPSTTRMSTGPRPIAA